MGCRKGESMAHSRLSLTSGWIACVVGVLTVSLLGQGAAGVITGTVTDPDGGPVPTASVQARNTSTGVVYKVSSAKDGAYTLSQVPAGTYDITVPPIGFTFPRFEQKGIVVSARQRVRVDIHLVWGGNLGTPGDDVTIGIRSKGSPKGPAPRTREGKPDLSGVWVGNAAEYEPASLLPWAETIFNERRANSGAGNPGTSCLPGDIFLVSPFIYKIIQTPAVIAILWEGNPPGVVQIMLNGLGHST